VGFCTENLRYIDNETRDDFLMVSDNPISSTGRRGRGREYINPKHVPSAQWTSRTHLHTVTLRALFTKARIPALDIIRHNTIDSHNTGIPTCLPNHTTSLPATQIQTLLSLQRIHYLIIIAEQAGRTPRSIGDVNISSCYHTISTKLQPTVSTSHTST